jgi:quercetin dioxygenase-like cupin family protein
MSAHTKPADAPARSGFVVEEGGSRTGRPLPVVGDEVTIKISSRDTGGAFATFMDTTPPHAGPPLHRHAAQDEWWYILEGDYLFEVDGEEIHAGPGATVFAPRGSVHTFMNTGSTAARSLITVVPGGLDLFFEDLSAAAPIAASVAANPELVAEIFRKHGLELLGPPLWARERSETK